MPLRTWNRPRREEPKRTVSERRMVQLLGVLPARRVSLSSCHLLAPVGQSRSRRSGTTGKLPMNVKYVCLHPNYESRLSFLSFHAYTSNLFSIVSPWRVICVGGTIRAMGNGGAEDETCSTQWRCGGRNAPSPVSNGVNICHTMSNFF